MDTPHSVWPLGLLMIVACGVGEPPEGVLQEISLTSSITGTSYDLAVFTPSALADPDGATVVYMFDGILNQGLILAEYARALDEGAEPAVLALVPGSDRFHDFTPTPNAAGAGGGQADFMAFVMNEFAPVVEAGGAGGSPEKRVTFGHSLGGLLSGTFWYDEPFAHRAAIASPSLWWDGGRYFAKLTEAPVNAGPIVVSCGEEEPMGMVVYTADFAQQMRQDYGIDVTYECFKDATHQEAFDPAVALTFSELL